MVNIRACADEMILSEMRFNRGRGGGRSSPLILLLDFLFQIAKLWSIEKLSKRNAKTVTKLFNCDDSGVFTFCVKYTVNSHRWHTRNIGKGVYSDLFFFAQSNNSVGNRLFGRRMVSRAKASVFQSAERSR